MAGVPFIFGNATTSIPLSNLDANFNTGLTIGNTTVGLGNTVTTLGNVTLTNVNIVSGTVPVPTSIANGTSNVSISSSGGNINVVTGGTIATFPQSTGTVMVSGNMPAFSASCSSGTSVSNTTFTKVSFQTENFDTNNNFASNRFTPTVAGYYQINATVGIGTATFPITTFIYKNGSAYVVGSIGSFQATQINTASCVSSLIYFNGSTDYVEIYVYQASGTTQTTQTAEQSQFSGCMVRGA